MGINWNQEAVERLICALLAAHPGLTPEYSTMAVYFGQGATYDSIQGRFRKYRDTAERMRKDNPNLAPPSCRTPARHTPGGGRVRKPSSTAKSRRMQTPLTPTKPGKIKVENGIFDAISVDDELDCFIKRDIGGSIPFAETLAKGTLNSGMNSENHFAEGANLKSEYDTNNDFLRGLENVTVSPADGSQDAACYSNGGLGHAKYAEYDDTA